MFVYSYWSWAVVRREDRLPCVSPGDFEVRQDERGPQERGGVTDVQAELGEDPPVFQVGEGVFTDRADGRVQLVDLVLRRGEGLVRAAL